jgi:hypothetical protein
MSSSKNFVQIEILKLKRGASVHHLPKERERESQRVIKHVNMNLSDESSSRYKHVCMCLCVDGVDGVDGTGKTRYLPDGGSRVSYFRISINES